MEMKKKKESGIWGRGWKKEGQKKEHAGEDISRFHPACLHQGPCGKKAFCQIEN